MKAMKAEIPPWRKILISIDEACSLAGVGRRVINEWRLDVDFPSFRAGEGERGNCKINRVMFEQWLEKRTAMRVGER